LHRTYVCDVERGARNVSLESIEKLARALEISVATLFSYGSMAGMAGRELVDILLVEDNADDAELAMAALKDISNGVQVVRDGQAALDFIFRRGPYSNRQPAPRPQLILLDLGLPKIDGFEVLWRVKSDPRTASIPVVVLTASDRERDIQMSKRLGAAACITKPVDLPNLTRVMPQLDFQWALLKPLATGSKPVAQASKPAVSPIPAGGRSAATPWR
jgi:CheY-like chemotaxis protein